MASMTMVGTNTVGTIMVTMAITVRASSGRT